ncbi:MAG: helix-turn-helix transcriptional regulator [Lachnospiraceae bacterium]|nr:helix-turn-helix transcriptional regulator [Lachnospiraceae bacterium]
MIRILLSSLLGERKMNQAELAKATGIRPNTISELYHELVERVNLEQIDLICDALDCDLNDLMKRVPDDSPMAKIPSRSDRLRSSGR